MKYKKKKVMKFMKKIHIGIGILIFIAGAMYLYHKKYTSQENVKIQKIIVYNY